MLPGILSKGFCSGDQNVTITKDSLIGVSLTFFQIFFFFFNDAEPAFPFPAPCVVESKEAWGHAVSDTLLFSTKEPSIREARHIAAVTDLICTI